MDQWVVACSCPWLTAPSCLVSRRVHALCALLMFPILGALWARIQTLEFMYLCAGWACWCGRTWCPCTGRSPTWKGRDTDRRGRKPSLSWRCAAWSRCAAHHSANDCAMTNAKHNCHCGLWLSFMLNTSSKAGRKGHLLGMHAGTCMACDSFK